MTIRAHEVKVYQVRWTDETGPNKTHYARQSAAVGWFLTLACLKDVKDLMLIDTRTGDVLETHTS